MTMRCLHSFMSVAALLMRYTQGELTNESLSEPFFLLRNNGGRGRNSWSWIVIINYDYLRKMIKIFDQSQNDQNFWSLSMINGNDSFWVREVKILIIKYDQNFWSKSGQEKMINIFDHFTWSKLVRVQINTIYVVVHT